MVVGVGDAHHLTNGPAIRRTGGGAVGRALGCSPLDPARVAGTDGERVAHTGQRELASWKNSGSVKPVAEK